LETLRWVIVAVAVVIVDVVVVLHVLKNKKKKKVTGIEGMIGQKGVVSETVAQSGKVLVHGEIWNARLASEESSILEAGAKVVVVEVEDGLVLRVKRVVTVLVKSPFSG
jgi:membrane-bound serine protease (ClpP class)